MILNNPQGYFSYDEHYGENDAKTEEGSKAERYTSWWRQPTDVNWVVGVDIMNDSAFVTFNPEISGIFHLFISDTIFLFACDTICRDTIIHYPYPKNIRDNVIRYVIFKHYSDSIGYRGWRLEKISSAEITSNPHTVDIDSVRIECVSYLDTVITNSLTLFRRRNIFRFAPEEEVILTVYSIDDIYAFLHARGRFLGFADGGDGSLMIMSINMIPTYGYSPTG